MTKIKDLIGRWKTRATYYKEQAESLLSINMPPAIETGLRYMERKDVVEACISEIEEASKDVDFNGITHFHIADNSDALRKWLDEKGVEWKSNGSFTSVPLSQDIFSLGMEFGVYKAIQGDMYK